MMAVTSLARKLREKAEESLPQWIEGQERVT